MNDLNNFDFAVSTIKKYEWIFNFAVTDLLTENVIQKINNSEWSNILGTLSDEEINKVASKGEVRENWPVKLKEFVEHCRLLSFGGASNFRDSKNGSNKIMKGIGLKKSMEINILSDLINEECKKIGVTHVVDFGCGLGHLAQVLSKKYGFTVLGLESFGSFVKSAEEKTVRQQGVTFKQLDVKCDGEKETEVEEVVGQWLNETGGQKACLIGLHTCGELASSTLRLFVSSTLFLSFIVLPCCFHKLNVEFSGLSEQFSSFPMSEKMKTAMEKYNGSAFLRRPFLRLASQMSAQKWGQMSHQEHTQHAHHVLARAALQLVAKERGLKICKAKRKALNKRLLGLDSDELVDSMMKRYSLLNEDGSVFNSDEMSARVKDIFAKNSHNLQIIEGLTALQCCLQEPADCLMFSDMQQFLTEHDLHLHRVERLWDETLSPRSHAIIASRNHTLQ